MTEISPVQLIVTAYQRHRSVCAACGEATWAALAPGVPTGGIGPRLQLTTAPCMGGYYLLTLMMQDPPDVSLVALGPGRHTDARQLPDTHAANPAGGGAAAEGRPEL